MVDYGLCVLSQEPAKYEFSYEVSDAETGTEFGHSESRDGDVAQGSYNVLLPDGRKQIVDYQADQGGYQPEIRYEGEASTGAGAGAGGFGGPGGAGGAAGRVAPFQEILAPRFRDFVAAKR
ncbi:pro-resilin-like [Schistocerca piceifrons]|uniref:pro-resilin-like n=1 Tax=Schistocerca piceifrons TaxID=274613 RepID=UPI001F5EE093|nr:pro-resilin-like [Schistocerca piceifrons]